MSWQTGDEALWEYLGNYCLGKENLISQLLDHIGQFFSADTAGFIAQIPNGMEIHNLKAKLQNLFEEALLNVRAGWLVGHPPVARLTNQWCLYWLPPS